MINDDHRVSLSASIQNYKTFKDVDKSLFQRLYLGYPYCSQRSDSFITEPDDLKKAIKDLKKTGKEAFLVTPGLMQTTDFEPIKKAINKAVEWGLDGIEINDVGMFDVAKNWPGLKVLAGFFTNIYHKESAIEYIKEGATTVLAHSELMHDELKEISATKGAQIGIAVYGNLPLGIVYDCYLKTIDTENKCFQQCVKPHYFDHKEFAIRNIGTVNVMAADFCLLEHIEKLREIKADYWRLETYLYDAKKINAIGRAFTDCINGADPSDYIDDLKNMSEKGLCDGWFLGKPGHSYSGSKVGALS